MAEIFMQAFTFCLQTIMQDVPCSHPHCIRPSESGNNLSVITQPGRGIARFEKWAFSWLFFIPWRRGALSSWLGEESMQWRTGRSTRICPLLLTIDHDQWLLSLVVSIFTLTGADCQRLKRERSLKAGVPRPWKKGKSQQGAENLQNTLMGVDRGEVTLLCLRSSKAFC